MSRIHQLVRELRRRRVFRAAAFYLIGAWGLLQVGDVVVEPAGLPGWTMTALLYLVVVGFPLAVFLGWRYEFGPEGLVRTRPVSASDSDSLDLSLKPGDYAILTAVIVVFALAGYGLFPTITETVPAPGSSRTVEVRPGSVAVLPFVDISASADQAYLGDGLADTVMHVLSQVEGLIVTARTSAFAFKGKDLGIPEIAEKLNVANVLEGSVQTEGDRVRIIARLIETGGGTELWSGNFDRELSGIFAIQDEISREVVAALRDVLGKQDVQIDESYRPDLEAYEHLVLGRNELEKGTVESTIAAMEHLERAIEIDPDYALAYVILAQAKRAQGFMSRANATELVEQIEPLVEKALDLEPLLGEAWVEKGWVQASRKDLEGGRDSVLRAIELNPSYAPAYSAYGNYFLLIGDNDQYLAQMKKAAELDPESDRIQRSLAQAYWSVARAEEALAVLQENIERHPDVPANYSLMARWLLQLDRHGEALLYTQALRDLDPANPQWWWAECEMRLQMWDFDAAGECMGDYTEANPHDLDALKWYADLRGDMEAAIDYVRRRVETQPTFWYPKVQLAELLGRVGDWHGVIDVLEPAYGNLLTDQPEVNNWTVWPARLMAQALQKTGDQDQAERILEASLRAVERMRLERGAGWVAGIEDAQIYALQGEKEKALDTLEAAVDGGWGFYSWGIKEDPSFESIADDPRFTALHERLGERMAAHRRWYAQHQDDSIVQPPAPER